MPPPPRAGILTFIVLLLLLFPDTPPPGGSITRELDDAVSEEIAALAVLNSTNFGDFEPLDNRWLNLTGFRRRDGFAWAALPSIKAKAKEHVFNALGQEHAAAALDGKLEKPLALYRNVSGYVIGTWVRSQLEHDALKPSLNLSTTFPQRDHVSGLFNRNITGDDGRLHIRLDERTRPTDPDQHRVRGLRAHITMADDNSAGEGWEMVLYGEHFVDSGNILLTTSSEKFSGLFGLPSLALSEENFYLARARLNRTLRETIRNQKSHKLASLSPWSSTPEGLESSYTKPNCDLIVYLQQHLLRSDVGSVPMVVDQELVEPIEYDLRYPAGNTALPVPRLQMSALLFSPDCGFVLESKGPPEYTPTEANHLIGAKEEVYVSRGRFHSLLFGGILITQVMVMMSQIKEASTPSTRSRISFYTMAMLALGDGFYCMSFLPLGMLSNSNFPVFLATAFIAFLGVTFFDLRFMMDIWAVQREERRRQERQQAAADARTSGSERSSAAMRNGNGTSGQVQIETQTVLPPPVTRQEAVSLGATPLILPSNQEDPTEQAPNAEAGPSTATSARREISSLYAKFYLVLLGTLFLSLNASQWYPLPRAIFTNSLSFIYLSFWIPQIHRNIMRNCRKALLWKFVILESVLRLSPFVYFYAYPGNMLFAANDRLALLVLVGWVWVQVWILVIQEIFGPRLFVPEGWAPPAYDYHPVLREDEEDAKMPIGFSQVRASSTDDTPMHATSRRSIDSKDKGKWIFDCAICMQDIEVPVVPKDGSEDSSTASSLMGTFLERRSYMVTPCRHIFHAQCLEAAMRYRLQCPICRETLPPL